MLDDAVALCGIRELEAQNLGIVFGLLEAVARALVYGLCLDNRNGEIAAIAEEVVRPLLRSPMHFIACNDNPAIGEGFLFTDLLVSPPSSVKLREYVFATGIGFGKGGHVLQELALSAATTPTLV